MNPPLEGRAPTRRPHGSLEHAVMAELRRHQVGRSARSVQESFDEPHPALTTVMTVLDRLRRKGVVDRSRGADGVYRFQVVSAQPSAAAEGMLDALLASGDRAAVLTHFTGRLTADDLEILRRTLATPGDRAGR